MNPYGDKYLPSKCVTSHITGCRSVLPNQSLNSFLTELHLYWVLRGEEGWGEMEGWKDLLINHLTSQSNKESVDKLKCPSPTYGETYILYLTLQTVTKVARRCGLTISWSVGGERITTGSYIHWSGT